MPEKVLHYAFTKELKGNLYRDFIQHSCEKTCAQGLVVLQSTCPVSTSCTMFLDRLKPEVFEKRYQMWWPGTILLSHDPSEVHHFRTTRNAVAALLSVKGMYDWLQPDLPEDLCLARSDGSIWLSSIASERESFLNMTTPESEDLFRVLPKLRQMLKPDPGPLWDQSEGISMTANSGQRNLSAEELAVLREVLRERDPALLGKILECGQSELDPTGLPDDIRAAAVNALGDEFYACFGRGDPAPSQKLLLLEDMIGKIYPGPR